MNNPATKQQHLRELKRNWQRNHRPVRREPKFCPECCQPFFGEMCPECKVPYDKEAGERARLRNSKPHGLVKNKKFITKNESRALCKQLSAWLKKKQTKQQDNGQ